LAKTEARVILFMLAGLDRGAAEDGLGMGLGFKKSAMGNDLFIWIRCNPLKSPDFDE
jgi:hypothetical protein